jgi:glycosyltransferase involved in cell wall biosynthesis
LFRSLNLLPSALDASVAHARVAIVVACHNDGATIRETLDSLRTEPNAELIVVDDGSTDAATLDVLGELESNGMRLERQANRGPSSAWMSGLRRTTAPYVMPFSSDDILIRGATELLADALDAAPTARFAWGDMETFGLAQAYRPSTPALCPWLVTFTNCMPPYSLFRRSLLLETGGWHEIAASEDWDLWMRLAARGERGVYVSRPIYRYRRGAGGRFRRRGRRYEPFYDELRTRNPSLFDARPANRRASPAPTGLKMLVSFVEIVPGLPRLRKMQISEALTLLFWSGGVRRTARILAQGIVFRARLLLRQGSTPPVR